MLRTGQPLALVYASGPVAVNLCEFKVWVP